MLTEPVPKANVRKPNLRYGGNITSLSQNLSQGKRKELANDTKRYLKVRVKVKRKPTNEEPLMKQHFNSLVFQRKVTIPFTMELIVQTRYFPRIFRIAVPQKLQTSDRKEPLDTT